MCNPNLKLTFGVTFDKTPTQDSKSSPRFSAVETGTGTLALKERPELLLDWRGG